MYILHIYIYICISIITNSHTLMLALKFADVLLNSGDPSEGTEFPIVVV